MSLKFLGIAGGIFVSFWVFGVVQERLFKGTFGPENERFTFVMTLLSVNQLASLIYSYCMLKIRGGTSEARVPAVYRLSIALTFALAMVASFMALHWVSYPAQVLAKSAKPIPVLLMGILLGNKSYHVARYVMVLLIVSGICLFMYRDDKAGDGEVSVGMGELLLALSLLMDGLYNSLQERIMSRQPIKSDQFMFDITQSSFFLLTISSLYSGELLQFTSFIAKYPSALLQVLLVSVTSALGQFCIYKCITEYGTLTTSIITTTRKFFTVFSSILIFGHVLRGRQWVGIVLVFAGLLLDIYYGKSKKPSATSRK
ncbi:unnamed protein product [Nesidiocoris tenuis]|uniref:Uncharacterized protein n=2 Tax=Nesidiocoris tenuis TaxID=355587 RepID=A0A6H5GYN6_9HEMI|nr:Solute carrier family 35 member B1 [Nesidiocoris tenuis]CAB0008948.1 unnamed protein product [Nesidiocoris tenuis]